jgi:hypothetical protein
MERFVFLVHAAILSHGFPWVVAGASVARPTVAFVQLSRHEPHTTDAGGGVVDFDPAFFPPRRRLLQATTTAGETLLVRSVLSTCGRWSARRICCAAGLISVLIVGIQYGLVTVYHRRHTLRLTLCFCAIPPFRAKAQRLLQVTRIGEMACLRLVWTAILHRTTRRLIAVFPGGVAKRLRVSRTCACTSPRRLTRPRLKCIWVAATQKDIPRSWRYGQVRMRGLLEHHISLPTCHC